MLVEAVLSGPRDVLWKFALGLETTAIGKRRMLDKGRIVKDLPSCLNSLIVRREKYR